MAALHPPCLFSKPQPRPFVYCLFHPQDKRLSDLQHKRILQDPRIAKIYKCHSERASILSGLGARSILNGLLPDFQWRGSGPRLVEKGMA